jgi:hypothetical protein
MKRCVHCKQVKPEEEFAWRWKAIGIRQKHCRDCMAKFNKASYDKKGEEERRRIYDNRDKRGEVARKYVWDYLSSHGCEECPESDPRFLEFHHRDPKTKKYNVSNMTNGRYSIQTIQKEIAKCRVLCVKCHRKQTYDERGWYRG